MDPPYSGTSGRGLGQAGREDPHGWQGDAGAGHEDVVVDDLEAGIKQGNQRGMWAW